MWLETWDAVNFCPWLEGLAVSSTLGVAVWDAEEFRCGAGKVYQALREWKQFGR